MMPIKKIKVIGERSSGSTYLYNLIIHNFLDIEIIPDIHPPTVEDYKHFTVDFEKSYSNDTLIICIIRNPYDWLRSLHRTPHHMPLFYNVDFKTFLTEPCISYGGKNHKFWDLYLHNDLVDRQKCANDEFILEKYSNILEMRKYKINKYLNTNFPNVEILSYDNLVDNLDLLKNIAEKYNIRTIENSIINLTTVQGEKNNTKYEKKTYVNIDPEQLDFINCNLDWEIENKLGFIKIVN